METAIAAIIILSLAIGAGGSPTESVSSAEAVQPPQYEVIENVTSVTELLESLPEPSDKPALAVYGIADKTGQYKENGYLSNSSAVTQGATEMLMTALIRSSQFTVLDRVNLQHILNELNLKSQNYTEPGTGPELGRILGADYIIEGAITEYDVDRGTGGTGIKIAGVGISDEYARATCAIDLRLTDATTGEVVWADSFKKEIYGKKTGLTVFTFMGDTIVEFETGKGMQQAINLVVRSLLEEAVCKMIEELELATIAPVEMSSRSIFLEYSSSDAITANWGQPVQAFFLTQCA